MRVVYALLCVVGAALPLSRFVPWLAENGFDVGRLLDEALGPPIAAFAWLDVAVSAIVVLALVLSEGRRDRVRHLWAPVVGLFTVGVSLALPLYLFLRERAIEEIAP